MYRSRRRRGLWHRRRRRIMVATQHSHRWILRILRSFFRYRPRRNSKKIPPIRCQFHAEVPHSFMVEQMRIASSHSLDVLSEFAVNEQLILLWGSLLPYTLSCKLHKFFRRVASALHQLL